MISLLGVFTACSFNPMLAVYDDDSKIASKSNTYNAINCNGNIDGTTYEVTAERFEGMDTVWDYDAKEDENVELTYSVSLYSGKMKLVLIAPDDSLTTIAEITSKTDTDNVSTYTLDLKKGINRIKVVSGKDTRLDMELSVPVGAFHGLG